VRRGFLVESSGLAAVHQFGLSEERAQDAIDAAVVLLLEARVRDAGYHRELLVRIRQPLEEFDEIAESGDAVELAAHNDRRHRVIGRSDKQRPINCDIANGADDLAAGTEYNPISRNQFCETPKPAPGDWRESPCIAHPTEADRAAVTIVDLP
jgi:hypothetical protein